MSRPEQEPTVRQGQTGKCEPHGIFTHPAYGTITMTTSTGGERTLFGSDLGHNQRISIRINTAELHRDLYRDWIHSRDHIIEFEMSHAQFAQFITSNGCGSGTPITIKWMKDVGQIPGIKNIQTKHETQRKEIHEITRRAYDGVLKDLGRLKAMLDTGKIGKRELAQIIRDMEISIGNAPANLAYAVESAEEALAKAASDARIEVESYVQMTAQRLGLKHIDDLAKLADKSKETVECNHVYSRAMNQDYPRKCINCGAPEQIRD